jgi:DNA-binding beta-propeller fold protein YncE
LAIPPRLLSPARIAFGSNDQLLVTDPQQRSIFIVQPRTMSVVKGYYLDGVPLGIAYGRKLMFVGNETTASVEAYDFRGLLVNRYGGEDDPIAKPTDIALDAEAGLVCVVDGLNRIIKVYNVEGQPLMSIPKRPQDAALLVNPTGITLDPVSHEIFVSDFGDPVQNIKARVQVFNYSGVLVGTISGLASSGMFGSQYYFTKPQGLALDNAGHLYVVESHNGQVQVFDRSTGAYVQSVGSYGTGTGQLKLPLDAVVHPSTGTLYVTNNMLQRIEVFQ